MSRTFPSNDGRNHLEETHNDIMSTPGHAPGRPPPPAPPLPPPLPAESCEEKRSRMRSFFWKPIPEDCLKDQAGPNVWTRNRTDAAFHIDLTALEELFGEKDAHPTSTTRRKTDPKGASAQPLRQQISILDSRRCMNISIFLKHFKHSSECVLDAVLHGRSGVLPAEFLRKLLSLLPGREEVKKLKMFSGSLMDLPAADAFMHQLVLLPRYEDRLEALLLNEEFFSLHASMKQDTALVLSAVKELLNCEELHHVLHLVLQAGNFMNSGVSASVANAVGFRLSSLLSLADTKANKPGMNLLNFVALEAQKKNLLMFPEKLPHVQQAARVCVDSLQEEFNTLSTRVQEQEQILTTDEDLHTQFCSFLKKAKEALEDLRTSTSEMLREGHTLIQFFCEDQELFTLNDCFQVFQNFCCKFKRAVQENMERMIWEESRGKRLKEMAVKQHSRAGLEARGGVCGLRSTRETDMKRALVREGLVELLDASPLLQFGGVHRSRQRKICHSMTGHDMNSDPSAHHLLQGLTISDRTAPTNSEDHKDPISALDDITKSNSDIKCITKLEQTLRDEGLQTLQQNSRDEENFALRTLGLESHRNTITVTADPHNQPIAQHKGKTSAKLLPRPKSSHKAPPTTNALLTTQRSSKPVSQLIVRSSVSSETKSLSKVVSLSPSGPQNQVQGVARKKQVAPEVKMCSRLRATPPAPIVKTTAGFTRSSTTSKQPPLTRSASLRLSQLLKQTQTLSTAPMPPPAGHLRKSGNAITPSLPTRAPRKQ